ncbi:Hint domain-containing protein [Paracoccus beibuensis]|uniref:Hint domain-containing protein n=1 Tax=Paracoccus beibuensis TaxID=547602 RepID=UPI00223FB01D|nr:Hint domain-containing protein [Paracoccus beibuensis]
MNYSGPLVFTGNHLARTASQPTNFRNPGDPGFGMEVRDASAVGGSTDYYRLVWVGNTNGTDTTFRNGQFWDIQKYDPAQDPGGDPYANGAGWPKPGSSPTFARLVPKDDLVAGMGGGENHIVLENQGSGGHLVLDLSRSFPTDKTNLFYPGPGTGQLTFDRFAPPPAESPRSATCFTPGTMIATPHGPCAIEGLAVGDLVLTVDSGAQPILWIGTREVHLDADAAHLRPIRLSAGALGPGMPDRDLLVSPQHRMLIRSATAEARFGSAEILVAAKQLVAVRGIDVVEDLATVTYIHILLPRHELVHANGAVTESMYAGPEALKTHDPDTRATIMRLAGMTGPDVELPKARLTPLGGQARRLAQHHARRGTPLVLPLRQQVPAMA